MNRKTIGCSILVVFLILVFSTVSFSSDPGPENLTLKSEGGSEKSPAVFPHFKHQKTIECAICHHGMTDDGKKKPYDDKMKVQKCEQCHNKNVLAGKKTGKYNLDDFKGAGHASCLECHKEAANKNTSLANLKSCKTCHQK